MGARACVLASTLVVAVAGTASGVALRPERAIETTVPVSAVALTGGSVAYVADDPVRLRCAQIGLWSASTDRRWRFDSGEQCLEQTSTGQGVAGVSVAASRLLWLTYAGGNVREWSLWTATTTRQRPRRLRFAAGPVDGPPPIVIGPGTPQGVPYAVGRRIVYLGADGSTVFQARVASPVRAIAAGAGRRLRVAALLASGVVIGLDRRGRLVVSVRPQDPVAVRVSGQGLAIQRGRDVGIARAMVRLPEGATMVDVAQGRVLWSRDGDLGATTIATGTSVRLVDGSARAPVFGQLEARSIAWSRGRSVFWKGAALPG